MEKKYFYVCCEKVDWTGKQILAEKNCGNLIEVAKFIDEHLLEFPLEKWELYPCFCS